MILLKAYQDVNGELVRVEEGSPQDVANMSDVDLIRVPAEDKNISADRTVDLDLDAKLDDSQLIDDDTFATATDSNIPSAESVKAYVDTEIANAAANLDEASEISYNNSTSLLTATDVQGAIDEVEARVDTAETNLATEITDRTNADTALQTQIDSNDTDITELQTNQNDLVTLTGVAENDTDLGTFSGSTISDNVDVKTALQEVETALDALPTGESSLALNTSTNILTHTSNAGTDTDIDLTMYIDDTNLARLVSGTIDGAGIVTFERDDATTFTIDFSTLLDNQDASEVPYDNTTSGLAATDTQSAIDEVEARVDTLEATDYVNTFNGRTGTVVAETSDYDAVQVDFDNTSNGFTSTDTQSAIEEVSVSLTKEYIYANQTIAQTALDGTPVTVTFDNEAIQSSGSVFSLNATTGEITVNKTSVFKIDYRVTMDTDDGARRTSETFLEVDTGAGFAEISAALGSSRAYGYHRNDQSGENTAAGQVLLNVNSGDVVRIRVRRFNNVGIISSIPLGTSISIEEK